MECIITVGKENKASVKEHEIKIPAREVEKYNIKIEETEIIERNVIIEIDDINVIKDMDIDKIFDYLFNKLEEKKSKEKYSFMSLGLNASYQMAYNLLMEAKKANNLSITIKCNKSEVASYIDILKGTKEKITIECTDLSLSEYFQILEKYSKEELESMNIDINYQKANSPIHISKLYTVSQTIKNIANEVNRYNLSELEKIMYVYDLVKSRIFTRDESDLKNSRDLDKVLLGDSIVCVGYSNLFNAILISLGIKAMPLTYTFAKHQRSIVYVKDSKYNIDGIYTFDPVGDRRRDKKDNNYLNRYGYFAIPLSNAGIRIPKTEQISYDDFTPVLEMEIDKINKILKGNQNPAAQISLLNLLNSMFMFAFDRKLERTDCITEEEYRLLEEKYNSKELTSDTSDKLKSVVRRIEYANGTRENRGVSALNIKTTRKTR